jgi:hypothetical protein
MAAEVSGGGEIADRTVASALEFAVGIAAAGAKLRPQLPFPVELKPFLKFTKLPPKALRDVRRAVEGDPEFFRRLAMVAVPDLLDEAGMLWLTRPEGWEASIAALGSAHAEAAPGDAQSELRRAERRRDAAEQVAQRTLAELVALRVELDRVQHAHSTADAEMAELRRERDALRGEAAAHHTELRRAVNRLATAQSRLEAQRVESLAATKRADDAERMRDAVLADRADGHGERTDGSDRTSVEAVLAGAGEVAADLARQAEQARSMAHDLGRLAGRLASLEPAAPVPLPGTSATKRPGRRGRRSLRLPVGLPGGVYGSSSAAAEFLVRHPGMVVLVDGYNVAKLGWPQLELEAQRERMVVTAEDVARRWGTDLTVVFDGADIVGASAPARRLVRVAFSPAGVSADDLLRAEVDQLPIDRAVVVVTNDQAIVADVRADGANTLGSDQFLAVARR